MALQNSAHATKDDKSGDTVSGHAGSGHLGAVRQFGATRLESLAITAPLSAEDQTIQSMPDVSPTKWHLAHTSWFFETFLLIPHLSGYREFDPAYNYLFNSYYESVGARHPRPDRGLLSRPPLSDIHVYRAHVDAGMERLLADADKWAEIAPLVSLGLHHEQQHQELILSDIKHVFSANSLFPAYTPLKPHKVQATKMGWQNFDGGLVEIGARVANTSFDDFAFDNEGPVHKVHLEPFALADRLVTNGEYLQFIEDGGYAQPEHWLMEGWEHIRAAGWSAPDYWYQADGAWHIFTLSGLRPLDPDEPVCHVSHYEADAYARWADKRLPREEEWELAARESEVSGNLLSEGHFHPISAEEGPAGEGPGLRQLWGDVWEWTTSPYTAFPGFKPAAGAVGEYNGKFMANQWVLKGGSCATPAGHIRASYRNFFPSAARWQFTGIRLADDV